VYTVDKGLCPTLINRQQVNSSEKGYLDKLSLSADLILHIASETAIGQPIARDLDPNLDESPNSPSRHSEDLQECPPKY
jgi:hypothetical protein